MSPSNSKESCAHKERTNETQAFVLRAHAITRRGYTSEEKIPIVLQGFRLEGN